MKRFFILFFVFCFISSVAHSAPNYDKNNVTTVYDDSENIAFRNKLEAEFDKKHRVDSETLNFMPEDYYREVLVPYDLNKKKMEDLPKRYYKIEDIK